MKENLTRFEDNKFILDNKYQIISDLRITQRKIRLKKNYLKLKEIWKM